MALANTLSERITKANTEKTLFLNEHYSSESAKEEILRKELNRSKEETTTLLCNLSRMNTEKVELGGLIKCLRDGIHYVGKDGGSRKLMLQAALKATGYCIQVSNCAEIYTAASQKYVMPRISSIGQQFALTPEMAQQRQLEVQCDLSKVDEAVHQLIEQKREEFNQRVDEQMETYAEALAEALTNNYAKAIDK